MYFLMGIYLFFILQLHECFKFIIISIQLIYQFIEIVLINLILKN